MQRKQEVGECCVCVILFSWFSPHIVHYIEGVTWEDNKSPLSQGSMKISFLGVFCSSFGHCFANGFSAHCNIIPINKSNLN
jgi:hypothetical protein